MTPPRASTDDVDMTVSSDEIQLPRQPPPRLAARFYRKPSARRRSSQHSSRCSSLSSISRKSALSCHGGPQSTHIAQHLRRASIIESRKARLADRAAHAERVRLRAAAFKAAPRATYSEEKALAAQAAREKVLAEITARCEEEVRRAKKVAEETREKRAAQDAKRRDELEEKYAEAARRRSLNQLTARRPRTISLAAVEERKISPGVLKKLSQVSAAKVIQRAWRSWHRRTVARHFLKLDLHASRLSNMSFEDVTKLISEDHSIAVAKTVLKQLDLLDGSNEEADRGAVRVFLSAFMILAHPVQAFSHGGNDTQERELILKSQALVDSFNKCNKNFTDLRARPVVPPKQKEQLQFFFNDFNAAFHAWKSQDLNVLLDVMISAFVNLDLILQTTKDDIDGRVAEEYLQAVRQEQIKLLARLKRLAGPEEAMNRVRHAVRKARRERALQQRTSNSDHVPRSLSSDTEATINLPSTELLTPPATPPRVRRASHSQASSLISRLGEAMTVLPTNREIAHEMQINGTFEVQQQPWTDSRRLFMESLRQSMRDSMQNGGAQVASSWTHAMSVLIREKLLNMISQRHPLYDRIDGFLDPKLIEQQSRNNAFSYASFFETIGDLISQICSPGRDEAVRSFIADNSSDTIDRLFALINIIDLMTLDHINFQFRMASRSVIEHGHEHEFGIFQRDLKEGKHTLEHANHWWSQAKSNLPATMAHNAAYGNAIYSRGLVDLVFSNSSLIYSDLPETLHLDWIRLLNLRAKIFSMVATSSILLTTKIRLRRNREALWAKDAERLMSLDFLSSDGARVVGLIESGHMMPDSTKEGLLNFVNRVLPPVAAAIKKARSTEQDRQSVIQQRKPWDPSSNITARDDVFTEQIATFILKSVREHVFARLSAASTAERVRVTTSASEVLARAGMPEFVGEVGNLVDVLERIKSVDLKAHGKWYDEIANAVAQDTDNAQ